MMKRAFAIAVVVGCLSPALANAVYDAIGVRFDEIPITPQKVMRALERKSDRVGPRKIVDFPFPDPIRVEAPADVTT